MSTPPVPVTGASSSPPVPPILGGAPAAAVVDVAEDTFVRVPPGVLRAVLDVPGATAVLWPGLQLTVLRDRGSKGMRWTVESPVRGELEVWLEPFADGTIVHHYLRGILHRPARRGLLRRAVTGPDLARGHVLRWKRTVHRLKDVLEEGVR